MGKVNCLRNRIESFPALFWALSILLAHILYFNKRHSLRSGIPQLRYSTAVERWVQFDRRCTTPIPFPIYVLFIYA